VAACYRHPSRETGVSCSSCGRPICPDCMTPTPVGMRCPECGRERTRVRTLRNMPTGPTATNVLIAINAIVFVAASIAGGGTTLGFLAVSGTVERHGDLYAPAIAGQHEYWRLVTSGFLHAGLLHLAFNMLFLYLLGNMLEPAIGRARFATLYLVSLLGGSLGALLLSPDAHTVGASGACFGILGGAIVVARDRGVSLVQSGLAGVLVINLVFSLRPGISIGGHLGGLVTGLVAGAVLVRIGERRRRDALAYLLCLILAVGLVAASLVVASHPVTS